MLGDDIRLVQGQGREVGLRRRLVTRNRKDERVVGGKERLSKRAPIHLKFGQTALFVSLNENNVARLKLSEEIVERPFAFAVTKFMHLRPASRGRHNHLSGARRANFVRVLFGTVNVKVMMRVLADRNPQTARTKKRHERADERRLAASGPAGDADDVGAGSHDASRIFSRA